MPVFGYRRLRYQHVAAAVITACSGVLVGWLVLANQKALLDFWLVLGFLGTGAAAFALGGVYVGRTTVAVTEVALSLKRPFRPEVSIPWSHIGEVTRFEHDKATDVVAAGGSPTITFHDQIDGFGELQKAVLDRARGRYAEVARRPGAIAPWAFPALVAALVVGLATWNWLDHGRVKVNVVDARGAPVPSAEVFFYNKQHPQPQDKADAAGFVERRLPSASYSLSVGSRGFETYRRRIEVQMLSTQEIRVTLEQAAF
jgi:hypothetical protein